MNIKLELKNIKKQYGNLVALDSIDISFEKGIIGVLGPNGAGKSTMIKIICQILPPDQGKVLFQGEMISKDFKSQFGLMPQQQELYSNFTVNEFMFYMCALKGIPSKKSKIEVNEKLGKVGLLEKQLSKVSELSGGMKQRLLIAQALLGNPPVLIFDEPTAGLDPKQRIEIRNMFSQLANDHIVIITTHVVQDIESIANKVIMIKNGKIVQQGRALDIINGVADKVKEIIVSKESLDYYQSRYRISNVSQQTTGYLLRIVTEEVIENAVISYPSLEDAYLWYVGDDV